MDTKLRKSQTLLHANRTSARLFRPEVRVPGSILSFVPARGASKTAWVAEEVSRILSEAMGIAVLYADFDAHGYRWRSSEARRRPDGRVWGGLVTEVDGLGVLGARDVQPRQLGQLIESAREYYAFVCADLSEAKEPHQLEVLRASDGIFLVSNSDRASLLAVREKSESMRLIGSSERCGLLLTRDPNGVSASEAEDITGVPVCSLIDTPAQIEVFAGWLASSARTGRQAPALEYALAV